MGQRVYSLMELRCFLGHNLRQANTYKFGRDELKIEILLETFVALGKPIRDDSNMLHVKLPQMQQR